MLAAAAVLWCVVIVLMVYLWREPGDRFRAVLRNFWRNARIFVLVVPVALLAASFLSPLIPGDLVARWLGASAGITGLLIATVAGWCLPVPPVIFFPVVAVLLKSGAGVAQMTALVAAWNVFAFHRTIAMELPIMGRYFVSVRLMSSVLVPPLAGATAALFVGGV